MHRKTSVALSAVAAIAAAFSCTAAHATPLLDGTIDAADGYGAPVNVYADNYVNGSDASGGTNVVSTYFTFDATNVYGAVHLDSGTPSPFPGANVYVYSSTANHSNVTGLPGTYGDGNDIIAEGGNGWGHADPSGITGGIHNAYSPSTVNYVYNGSDTVEFSIARSMLGDYDSFRFGGQLFGYEFHTGGDSRLPGAIVAVPEPASLGLLALGGVGLLARRRRRIA